MILKKKEIDNHLKLELIKVVLIFHCIKVCKMSVKLNYQMYWIKKKKKNNRLKVFTV
jgi:hypothetical protein